MGAPLSEMKTMTLFCNIPASFNPVTTLPMLWSRRETIAACFLRFKSEMKENLAISSSGAWSGSMKKCHKGVFMRSEAVTHHLGWQSEVPSDSPS